MRCYDAPMTATRVFVISIAFILCALTVPLFLRAQDSADELRAAIRASLSQDVNTARMTPEEYAGLVEALTVEAQKQGIPPSTLAPHSSAPASVVPTVMMSCVTISYLCSFAAFLHLTEMHAIWLILGIIAGMLAIVVGVMLGHHRTREVVDLQIPQR